MKTGIRSQKTAVRRQQSGDKGIEENPKLTFCLLTSFF